MRYVRPPISVASRLFSTSKTPPPPPPPPPPTSDLQNLLLVATISKSLTRHLLPSSATTATITDPVVLQILRRSSLHPSHKLSFFLWASSLPTYTPSSSAYSSLFRSLSSSPSHTHDLLPLLRRALSTAGHSVVTPSTFHLVLDAFLRSGLFDSAIAALDLLQQFGGSPDSCVYNSIVRALLKESQLGLALSVFYKLLEGSVAPDAITCNELLLRLRRADMPDEFRKVFDELTLRRFQFDTWGYNICISAFGRWGDLGLALRLFKEMKKRGPRAVPDLCTFNSLIKALCLAGMVDDALMAYEELKESGLEPDVYTYRSVIEGCCKTYRINDATRVFREMDHNNVRGDTIVYNSLLDGLFKARKLTDACKLFEKMVSDGVKASCCSYNILIDGLFRNDRSEAAFMLFHDLKKKGQFVDEVTYSTMVLHLCRGEQVDGALELVEEMEARGFVVDLVTVTTVLIGLHKRKRWDRAERLMKCVRNSSLVTNVLKWTSDMEATLSAPQDKSKDFMPLFPFTGNLSDIMSWVDPLYEKDSDPPNSNGELKDEWSLSPYVDQLAENLESFRELRIFSMQKGKRVQEKGIRSFDNDMINTYMSIFLSKGKLSTACKLYEIFVELGHRPVVYTYNSLLSSFVKKGYLNEAWGILQKMGEKFSPADIATYNVIIQGLGKMGKANLASDVVDQLVKKGGYLDIVMYNTVIHTLGKAGRLDEANILFKQMTKIGINPDVVTFNILIEIHAKAGKVKEAHDFLRMMLNAGCSPNHITDTILDFLEKEIEKLRYQKASIKREKEELDNSA